MVKEMHVMGPGMQNVTKNLKIVLEITVITSFTKYVSPFKPTYTLKHSDISAIICMPSTQIRKNVTKYF